MDSTPAFLTVSEVAATLRVSDMTIYRLITSGEIRALKVGRSYRIPAAALDEWLSDRSNWEPGQSAQSA
ncbi:MAG: helix-turn-helix domain-containing protein [Bifidobacteriaceae bacterium]|jgi:excisionase family DNA binding protein|nr:helix-turn-helix domain-containing protein [Bifidobacteriaceae bacterium]